MRNMRLQRVDDGQVKSVYFDKLQNERALLLTNLNSTKLKKS